MGRIQSAIGLITGIPIADTVEALMGISAKPRNLLIARTEAIIEEQFAVTKLTALLVSVRYITANLGKTDLYDEREATSSHPDNLSVTMTGKPPRGTYRFTPLRMVQSQQLLSSGFESDTDPLGGGTFSFRFGDHVQRAAKLELFGGGQGVVRGQIRITDRSGVHAVVDLSTVQTVDDVLDAINGTGAINVTAVAHGGSIRLIDNTGQTVSNLKVQEVGNGATAASLGFDGIDVADDVADGANMLGLYAGLDLDELNDGRGVRINSALPDVEWTLRDGTSSSDEDFDAIDFSPLQSGGSTVEEDQTLGDLLDAINAAAPGKLKAEIGPDGQRLVITDLTTGNGEFTLTATADVPALADLGLASAAAVDGVITGGRILGGAKTVLLSSLNGGQGFGQLGAVELSDRSGASDTIDLSSAETLEEVVDLLNAADVGIVAAVNRARNGIELTDTTGAQAANLIVTNADATETADKLGIALDEASSVKNSGDMHLQVVAHNTRLDDLNGGGGVARGSLTIYDSRGMQETLNLRSDGLVTIGDVVQEINRSNLALYAEINETGDGIRLVDTGGGAGTLRVEEGNTTTAADLHLLADAKTLDIDGQTRQAIDGSTTYKVEIDDDGSLEDLRQAINELGAGVTATTFVDGSSRPYRLSLTSERPGRAGALLVDTSQVDFSVDETVRAQDALLVFGDANTAASSVLVSSKTNEFQGVLAGVKLEILQATDEPVTVTVSSSDTNLIANVRTMVGNYNKFRDSLVAATEYNVDMDSDSVLTGDATALRLDIDLSMFLSGPIHSAGPIKSLAEIGVSFNGDGTLSFDESKLTSKFAADPDAVEQFFTTEQLGFAEKFNGVIDKLSDLDNSLLTNRRKTLDRKIWQNEERIEFMNARLDVERERLYLQFYRLELAIGKMQASLATLNAIQPLDPITRVRRAEIY